MMFLSGTLCSKQLLKYVFCKWGRGHNVLSSRNNNFLNRTIFLELWPLEMLYLLSNLITSPSVLLFQMFS